LYETIHAKLIIKGEKQYKKEIKKEEYIPVTDYAKSKMEEVANNGLTGLSQFASKYLGIERKVNNEKNTIIWAINTRYIDINVEL
jgi:hypothetical protein